MKLQIGLTFAGALRSFLRHDPDIMMNGEIRDLVTAQIAVQAALTKKGVGVDFYRDLDRSICR